MNAKVTMKDGEILEVGLTEIDDTGITGTTANYAFFYPWRDIVSVVMIEQPKPAVALGSMTSERKARTSAENGRKGGREGGEYTAWVSNDQGASATVEGSPFTSYAKAAQAARQQFGSGWVVKIIDPQHNEVKRFVIR